MALIRLSVDSLENAIALFPKITETNLDHAGEQGDCYSLLGRTYFVAGEYQRAEAAARESLKYLTDETSKDFADLQILLGDLVARQNADAATGYYDRAIEVAGTVDAERSEIAARAFFRKGLVARSVTSLDKAAEIWDRLEEVGSSANARWQCLLLTGVASGKPRSFGNGSNGRASRGDPIV